MSNDERLALDTLAQDHIANIARRIRLATDDDAYKATHELQELARFLGQRVDDSAADAPSPFASPQHKSMSDQRDNLIEIRDALRVVFIDAELSGGGAAANEWVEFALNENAGVVVGYPERGAPLAFNVLHHDGDAGKCGDVNVGDEPEAVANWAVGFLSTNR